MQAQTGRLIMMTMIEVDTSAQVTGTATIRQAAKMRAELGGREPVDNLWITCG